MELYTHCNNVKFLFLMLYYYYVSCNRGEKLREGYIGTLWSLHRVSPTLEVSLPLPKLWRDSKSPSSLSGPLGEVCPAPSHRLSQVLVKSSGKNSDILLATSLIFKMSIEIAVPSPEVLYLKAPSVLVSTYHSLPCWHLRMCFSFNSAVHYVFSCDIRYSGYL